MVDVEKAYAVNNDCYKAGRLMTPKGIVVHSTGVNNPNLSRYVDYPEIVGENYFGNHWNIAKPDGISVCVHAFIGYDKDKKIRIVEILPLNYCCWGVGRGVKGSYNYDPPYIQFEICEDSLDNEEYYTKAFELAAQYCAHLCSTYTIDIDCIVGHNEAYERGYGSNHSDPEHWMKRFGQDMDDFRDEVKGYLNFKKDCLFTKEKNSEPKLVKVTVDALNIRTGPGTIYPKSGGIVDRGVYTIVEEKNGFGASKWGKLKSGAGWIALDYTRKI